MYSVSSDFQTAILQNTRRYYWSGQITTKNGTVHTFDENAILKGSGSISSACCGSTEIEIGGVYASELNITLLTQIDRYTLEDAIIEIYFNLLLPGGTYETVPMGIFEISEANRSVKCLEIKAYDYMLRFDKDFGGFETAGEPYDFLDFCAEACGVTLAQTQAEIEAFPNGTQVLSIYSENDIETYRDVLYYVAQVLGGFCVINREGKLEIRNFGNTYVLEVSNTHRFSSSFSDFITKYTAVSSTNKKTETAEYYHLTPDDGLTMNLGVNPLLQYGLEETRRTICTNILNAISVINYLPFDSDTIGNPALDLGDVIKFSGGQADSTKIAAITSIQQRIGGRQTLKCVGKNPRLAQAKSKNDKNISGLINKIDAERIATYKYINSAAYNIGSEEVCIIYLEFASKNDTDAQFNANILLNVTANPVTKTGSVTVGEETYNVTVPDDGQAEVKVTYVYNDNQIAFMPIETLHSGKHILSLHYPLNNVEFGVLNTFRVYISVTNGSASILARQAICTISGQGLNASNEWNGNIDASDTFCGVALVHTDLMPELSDTVTAATQQPAPATVTQQYAALSMGFNLSVGGLTAVVTPSFAM